MKRNLTRNAKSPTITNNQIFLTEMPEIKVGISVLQLIFLKAVIFLKVYIACMGACLSAWVCVCVSLSRSVSVYVCVSVTVCRFVCACVCMCVWVCGFVYDGRCGCITVCVSF